MSGFDAFLTLVLVLMLIAVGIGVYLAVRPDSPACGHGESSIVVTVGKDGRMRTSGPFRTGCFP